MPLIALPHPARRRASRVGLRVAAAVAVLVTGLGPFVGPGRAAEGLTMEARILLQGHARIGSWMAIAIDLTNGGPAVTGEVRLPPPAQTGAARYSIAVDLPTDSAKTYVLYAQPPAFGRDLKLELVAGGAVLATVTAAFVVHDTTQLVVGVVAEKPQGIIAALDLPASQSGSPAVIVPLGVADLPERVEGWSGLDRLVWQDIDSDALTSEQLAALRGWLAAGGRLIIVGGTAGIGTLSGFPDAILPFRPTATVDVDPSLLAPIVGPPAADATDVPAMAGPLASGRVLASVGDSVIAAETRLGSGTVTVLGFDPSAGWVAEAAGLGAMWLRALPPRGATVSAILLDDNQLVSAVSQLPSLALPPIGGLLLLLAGYIVLVGPVNYLVLRKLDRREWAWVTMPALIVVFAVAAYGYGALLKGTDIVVNEVAIVRGAPGTSAATAQVYLGVFSPTRGRYQLEIANALVASPMNGEFFGGTAVGLDVLQGEPARVRDLDVGVGSLRTIRAETTVEAPTIDIDLALVDGVLTGTVVNRSETYLESVAVVLGTSVAVLGDIPAGESRSVSLPVRPTPFGDSISNRILGQIFYDGSGRVSPEALKSQIRHSMIDQLTYDPTGQRFGGLSAESPVLLAFGGSDVLDVRVAGVDARRTGNTLFYVPAPMRISGTTTFSADLLRITVVDQDAEFFSKDPYGINFGTGSVTMAYRPIGFEGTFTATKLGLSLNWGPEFPQEDGKLVEPLVEPPDLCTDTTNTLPEGCEPRAVDGIAEIELFDRTGDGTWVRLPHLTGGGLYSVADPARYVDPTTGELLIRFVNPSPEGGVGFGFALRMTGVVR